jgi:hypothetical protein
LCIYHLRKGREGRKYEPPQDNWWLPSEVAKERESVDVEMIIPIPILLIVLMVGIKTN